MSALRVLLIGAETTESDRICAVLAEADHSVIPVPSLDEASEALSIQKFDAVLITTVLSSEALRGFTTHLREAEKGQRGGGRTPVVSLLPGSASNGSAGTVDAYLSGRFEPAAFARTVEKLAEAVTESQAADGLAPAPELPVFNVEEFEAQVAYDRELMVEIIDLFLAERTNDVAEMTESLATGDLQQLMRSAHTIKGSLGSLHASLARYRSQELESAAKSGNRQACIALLGALEQDLNELEPRLLSLRASAQAK